MNRPAAPTPGVFHFFQHKAVSPQAWHSFCQAVAQAHLKMREYPDTLGLTTAPVICEYTGNRPLSFDDSVIGLGMIGFNGDRAAHQAGDPFLLYRRQTPHAPIRCDTRGYPYQWLVMATLLLANTYSPNTWTIESDAPLKAVALSRLLADPTLSVTGFSALRLIAMKAIDKVLHSEPKKPALIEYQQLLAWLLDHCYGLTLNDTPYHDPLVIAQQIECGITVGETINELVQKFDLVRVDRPGFSLLAQDPTLSGSDMLRARSALGLRTPINSRLV